MLIDFFYTLRAAKLPVSVKEYLMLLEALQAGVVGPRSSDGWSLDDFYFLARTTLVKDEKHYDKFDRAFAAYFKGVEMVTDFQKALPEEWLRKLLERELTPEQKAAIEKMDWDTLMETLKKRLEEQKERHEGGNKWIGTGGTSPFGHGGYNPQGVRIGGPGRNRSAVKVWEQRAYRDYDDTQELGTRNIKMAMRRLRKFARQGGELELDLPDTIRSTAANAGWLDIKLVPERHNNVKVLLLMDVGGTMDDHIQRVEAPGVLLLPQLRLRLHVEEQPTPLFREVRHLGHHSQIQQGLQVDICGRCHHEPLRNFAIRRQRGISQ